MVMRGTFDNGDASHHYVNWYQSSYRWRCINNLGVEGINPGHGGDDVACSWDERRKKIGSPFHLNFDWDALISRKLMGTPEASSDSFGHSDPGAASYQEDHQSWSGQYDG